MKHPERNCELEEVAMQSKDVFIAGAILIDRVLRLQVELGKFNSSLRMLTLFSETKTADNASAVLNHQAIAHAAHGQQPFGFLGISLDHFTQPAHMDLNGARVARVTCFPNGLHQVRAR